MFHVLRAILVLEYNVQPVIPPANGENGMAEYCTQVLHHVFILFTLLICSLVAVIFFHFRLCCIGGGSSILGICMASFYPAAICWEEQWILPLSTGVPRVSHPVRKLILDCRRTAVNLLRAELMMLPFRVKFDQTLL